MTTSCNTPFQRRLRLGVLVLAGAFALAGGSWAQRPPAEKPQYRGELNIDSAAVNRLNSAQLREAYLNCEYASSSYRISREAMAYCSLIADVLLQRDFAGELDRQLAWWRQARRLPNEISTCKREQVGIPDPPC